MFSNRRTIPAAEYGSGKAWLAGIALTELDRAQLLAVLRLFEPELGEEEMLAGDAEFYHARVQSIAEVPVEWWDVGGEFQLWLCNADGGFLFDAGTTDRRAGIIQWSFDLDEELSPETRARIAEGAARAVAEHPDSLLAAVEFPDATT